MPRAFAAHQLGRRLALSQLATSGETCMAKIHGVCWCNIWRTLCHATLSFEHIHPSALCAHAVIPISVVRAACCADAAFCRHYGISKDAFSATVHNSGLATARAEQGPSTEEDVPRLGAMKGT